MASINAVDGRYIFDDRSGRPRHVFRPPSQLVQLGELHRHPVRSGRLCLLLRHFNGKYIHTFPHEK